MKKGKGFFITGTDTGVGKTIVTSAISLFLKDKGHNVFTMKPIETGCKEESDTIIPEDGTFFTNIINLNEDLNLIVPIKYRSPLAPLVASEIEKKEINLESIKKTFNYLINKYDIVIVEGIGGLMVPIKMDYFVLDLIKEFSLPVILVTRATLGTINHTLLSLNALHFNRIDVAGIIVNHPNPDTESIAEKTNHDVISRLSKAPVIGILPYIEKTDVNSINNISKNINYDILKKYL